MNKNLNRLEIIHLRLAGSNPATLAELIRTSIGTEKCPVEFRIYHHSTVTTDIALHLLSSEASACASDLGVRLTEALREHGMVEHAVWIEEAGHGAG